MPPGVFTIEKFNGSNKSVSLFPVSDYTFSLDILYMHPDFSAEANAVGGPTFAEKSVEGKRIKLLVGQKSS